MEVQGWGAGVRDEISLTGLRGINEVEGDLRDEAEMGLL